MFLSFTQPMKSASCLNARTAIGCMLEKNK